MKKKLQLSNFAKWNPQKETIVAFTIGTIIILLSYSMKIVESNVYSLIFIRDILMILICGISVPLFIIDKETKYKEYGIHLNKWYIYLPINLILGFLVLLMFLEESPPPSDFIFTNDIVWKIIWIMLVGVFEVIVFYSFIRTVIERSFGIIPAIIIASAFYAFHHAGFQPEFGKMFIIGILYITVFRTGNSALLVFPFFWGVGACYDVLVQSTVVSEIIYPEIRALILFVGIGIIISYLKFFKKREIAKH